MKDEKKNITSSSKVEKIVKGTNYDGLETNIQPGIDSAHSLLKENRPALSNLRLEM
jgi:hypothetical protein